MVLDVITVGFLLWIITSLLCVENYKKNKQKKPQLSSIISASIGMFSHINVLINIFLTKR